ncbi:NADH dehydrogenase (ubiquinone) 1 alpha subcomplex, 2, 8kDa [Columba livia]|uniref:NADH dehydrogenase [ubiquinone] 1 alpha subcomplex subunit 2 n=1 Tax=Columba livia TaxID=8932 RepID=A0A2I0LQQ8_COLLI|nr:NADH dehydrogenase (ubiquinone) 1 alpha subcomplex, 2, 8kDa [Columba livia]
MNPSSPRGAPTSVPEPSLGGPGASLGVSPHPDPTPRIPRNAPDFIEQHYVTLKKANPDFPILIRECSGVQPRLWARYEFGKEKSVSLDNLSVDQVAKALEDIVKSKA